VVKVSIEVGNGATRRNEMSWATMSIYLLRILALLAAAVLAAGLLAFVGAKPAWAADPSFAPAQHFPVGTSPTTVTNADFNGDGKQDLAAQNFGTDNVSVLLGNGDGTFQGKQDFTVGDGPTAVISADFNSDGIADLAVSNQNSNNVSVLLGNGDGTFRGKPDLAAGTSPTSVAGADFDGDGDADLAVSNSASNNVSVLLGNGDGTFGAAQPYSVSVGGISPNQIITDDFDGDGDVDLATAHVGDNVPEFPKFHGGVTILFGNGDGTFQNARKVVQVFLNYSVASADFDDDGDRDLVATHYGMTSGCCISGGVSVALGNGDGTFGAARFIRVGTGHTGPSSVASADFDGDEDADLAVSNSATDDVSVMLGSGDGTFGAAQNFPANDLPAFVISTDLNADGVADLAVANQNSNNVSVLMNKTVDTIAPRVVSVTPADGATGVALNTNVDATFSETMDPSTITDQTFTLTKQGSSNPVAARVLYDSASKKATLYPAISLEADASYTATIRSGSSGVKDLAGNALSADKVWTFSTVDTRPPAPPVITSPPNNSIDIDGNFAVSGTAEAKSTVELFEGSASRGTATADGSGNWSISLTGVGEGSHTYTARARDAAGNTSDPSDALTVEVEIPPLVTSVSPADGTPNVAPNTNVEATFSEAMSPSTLNASTFTLKEQGSTTPVEATVSYDEATKTATLDPSAGLEPDNTTYTATIKGGPNGARDAADNALAADKVWAFSTVDITAPPAPVIASPANDSFDRDGNFMVSGTAENGSTVELLEGASIVGTVTADGSGDWSVPLGGVTQGEHTYTARAKDAANNTSGLSNLLKVTVDATAPRVDSTVPVPGAKGVARGTNITATFSDRMDESTLTAQFLKLVNTATGKRVNNVAVSYDDATRTLSIDPFGSSATLLAKKTKYKVTIATGMKNLAGISLDQNPSASGNQPKSWTFTTGSR
jgi:hypothetical protein